MPAIWSELSPSRRLEILYELLKTIQERQGERTAVLLDWLKKTYDLKESAARKVLDVAWFAGMVKTEWRGFPARPYLVLTDFGVAILLKGKADLSDIDRAGLDWLSRSIRRWKPVGPPQFCYVRVKDFEFWVGSDWKFCVYVETPKSWMKTWQVPYDPNLLRAFGVAVPSDHRIWSVRDRAAILVATHIAQISVNRLLGYKWIPMTDTARTARIAGGRPLKRYRWCVKDPDWNVKVSLVGGAPPGRERWEVDFSAVSEYLPRYVDIHLLKSSVEELKVEKPTIPREAEIVPSVWSKPPPKP
jgi:hypothetical protein